MSSAGPPPGEPGDDAREARNPELSESGERRLLRQRSSAMAQRAAREVRDALRPFTIPNGITLVRLALTPFFVLAVVEHNFRLALGIFVVAGLTDALDGALARLLHMRSAFGAYLDPIADKVLLVTAYIALTWLDPPAIAIPVWLTVMALSRDAIIVLVALMMYAGADIRDFRPSIWGKTTTFVHILTVGVVLLANVGYSPGPAGLLAVFYAALALTIISGVDYVRRAAIAVEAVHKSGD